MPTPLTPVTVKLRPKQLAVIDNVARKLSLDGNKPATRSDVFRALLAGRVPTELLKAATQDSAA